MNNRGLKVVSICALLLIASTNVYAGGCSKVFSNKEWLPNTSVKLSDDISIYFYGKCGGGYTDCYDLGVGSINSKISGTGSNCSDKMSGGWAVSGCGKSSSVSSSNPQDALKKIVELCLQ